jgi:acyl carrier protein
MTDHEISDLIDRIRSRCERPNPIAHVKNLFTCDQAFTLLYDRGSLLVQPGNSISFSEDGLVIRDTRNFEADGSKPVKDGFLSALAAGVEALGATEHRIRWNAISGITEVRYQEAPPQRNPPRAEEDRVRPFNPDKNATLSVKERLKRIVMEQLQVNEFELTDAASFTEDLGADSLDQVELVMTCEQEFDIEIPDEEVEKIRTLSDAVNYLASKIR